VRSVLGAFSTISSESAERGCFQGSQLPQSTGFCDSEAYGKQRKRCVSRSVADIPGMTAREKLSIIYPVSYIGLAQDTLYTESAISCLRLIYPSYLWAVATVAPVPGFQL
jgi:hypothetical protein